MGSTWAFESTVCFAVIEPHSDSEYHVYPSAWEVPGEPTTRGGRRAARHPKYGRDQPLSVLLRGGDVEAHGARQSEAGPAPPFPRMNWMINHSFGMHLNHRHFFVDGTPLYSAESIVATARGSSPPPDTTSRWQAPAI